MDENFIKFIEKHLLKVEVFVLVATIAGILLKYNDVWYGNIIIICTLIAQGASYFIYARLFRTKTEYGIWPRFFMVFAHYGACFAALGILFKSQFWPGGLILVMTGLAATAVGSIAIALMHFRRQFNLRVMLYRTMVWLAISVWVAQISPMKYVELMYAKDPEYIRLFKQYNEEPDNELYYYEWRAYDNLKRQ